MPTLTPSERATLRAHAHHLDPVVMIGDAGLTDAVMREIDLALGARELIKVRVLGDDRAARTAHAEAIAGRLDAALVQAIGKLLVLYRPRPPETAKPAGPRARSGPRRTKKQEGARAERNRAAAAPRAKPPRPRAPARQRATRA
ncbi:MAG: ribosome assembly RNA-binding protein YhbY [Burkholderiales bacterium]|nr:ribosome assembly RNA-binding protein YhbY [Burkholderiales bacterium]